MTPDTRAAGAAVKALNRDYIRDFPLDAAKLIETMTPVEAAEAITEQSPDTIAILFGWLAHDVAAQVLQHLSDELVTHVLEEMSPNATLSLLGQFEEDERARYLAPLGETLRGELGELMSYPEDSAGRLMETRIGTFRPGMSVAQALERLRHTKLKGLHSLFLVDDDARLCGKVLIHDLAISDPQRILRDLAEPSPVVVTAMDPVATVVEILERSRLPNIPVVNFDGHLIGVIRYASLVKSLEETASGALQTMVGASKDERALSKPGFAIRKRQPWLQINLLTAFMAAAVVGLFESTIAQVTALAVLLPVVAGQSGNAGAQALAVTMRGLALREITIRHWRRVSTKEVIAGFVNGAAIAVTCGLGVLIWSGSFGLLIVIASSMVLAMTIAGLAGAMVPIALKRFGQDPAQSSSIVLTTVTDIVGFFSFLGIATIFMDMI